jgi:hypothetical protein
MTKMLTEAELETVTGGVGVCANLDLGALFLRVCFPSPPPPPPPPPPKH